MKIFYFRYCLNRVRAVSFFFGSLLFILFSLSSAPADEGLLTALEASRFQELSKNEEIISFLTKLAEASRNTKVIWTGRSAGQRGLVAVAISKDPDFLIRKAASGGKPVVMLLGSQHGSEPSGAEVLQICARELAHGKQLRYLDYFNFILLPVSNPDGFDRKLRVNANGVNLSTDYALVSQPETQAVIDLLQRFQPDVLLDIHESAVLKKKSLGKQGYLTDFEAQFECANHAMVDADMLGFSLDDFLPALLRDITAQGLTANRYIGEITDIRQPIQHGGLSLRNLRNYAGFQGVFAWLLENRLDPPGSYPSPRNIKVRVEKQYLCVVQFLEQIVRNREKIFELVGRAKKNVASGAKNRRIALNARYVPHPAQPTVVLPLRRIDNGKMENICFPNHGSIITEKQIPLPAAYAVTGEHEWVAALLRRHNIRYELVSLPQNRPGVRLLLKRVVFSPPLSGKSRLGIAIDVSEKAETIMLNPGDLLIHTNQPQGGLVPLLLDPRSADSVFQDPVTAIRSVKQSPFFISLFSDQPDEKER